MKSLKTMIIGSLIGAAIITSTVRSDAAVGQRRFDRSALARDMLDVRNEIHQDRQELREDRMDLGRDKEQLREDRRDDATRGEIRSDRREIQWERRDIANERRELRANGEA